MDIESSVAVINPIFFHLCFNNPYTWSDVGWWIDRLGVPLSIVVAIFLFYRQQKIDQKKRNEEQIERKHNAFNALSEEIKEHKKAFDNARNNPLYGDEHIQYPDDDIDYCLRLLNTDAYESVIHSGLFTYPERETQNSLSNLYMRIRNRNELLKNKGNFTESSLAQSDSTGYIELLIQMAKNNEKVITIWEQEIRDLMGGIETLFKKELS
jgi:hypothetical protein